MCASHELPPKVGDSTNADTTSRPVSRMAASKPRALGGKRSPRGLAWSQLTAPYGLDENQADVGAADARQAGVHRRALPENGAAAPGHLGDEQPRLPREGAASPAPETRTRGSSPRRRTPLTLYTRPDAEQHDHHDGQRPRTRRSVRRPMAAFTVPSAQRITSIQHEGDQRSPPRCEQDEPATTRRGRAWRATSDTWRMSQYRLTSRP